MRSWTLTGDAWLTSDSVMLIIFEVSLYWLSYWSPSRHTSGISLVCPPLWDGLAPSEICLIHLIPVLCPYFSKDRVNILLSSCVFDLVWEECW